MQRVAWIHAPESAEGYEKATFQRVFQTGQLLAFHGNQLVNHGHRVNDGHASCSLCRRFLRRCPGPSSNHLELDCVHRHRRDCRNEGNAGQWLTGAIRGPVATGSIMKGYKVFVDKQEGSSEMLLEKVPSWRVRRRFPPRSNIEVYRGPLYGWMPGVVHSVITEFAAEPPVALSPFSPGCSDDPEPFVPEVPGQQPPQVANESSDWHREDAATVCGSTVAGDEGVSVLPWMQVPVYVEEWDEAEWGHDPDLERAQWVPSYLIRMRMIRLASTNESRRDDRRSFMT